MEPRYDQWEYRWEASSLRKREAIATPEDAAMLQQYGEAGWELVSAVAVPWKLGFNSYIPSQYQIWYYFKRRKLT